MITRSSIGISCGCAYKFCWLTFDSFADAHMMVYEGHNPMHTHYKQQIYYLIQLEETLIDRGKKRQLLLGVNN
jgi:hypothetical protein